MKVLANVTDKELVGAIENLCEKLGLESLADYDLLFATVRKARDKAKVDAKTS